MRISARRLSVSLAAIALLGLVAVPSFAAHGPTRFNVIAAPRQVQPGNPVLIIVLIKHASPSCAYTVLVRVAGPEGMARHKLSVMTNKAGNGIGFALYPDSFTGAASTSDSGTYTAFASFQCQYTYVSGAASAAFVVRESEGHH